MPRKPLPDGEKKQPITIFVKEKNLSNARQAATEIERKYNTETGVYETNQSGMAGGKDHPDHNERLA